MMRTVFLIGLVLGFCFQSEAKSHSDHESKMYWNQVRKQMPEFSGVFKKHKKFRFEAMVTRVHRNDANRIDRLQRFHYGDSLSYHYPASTVKLPAAVFLLEKLRMQLKGASIEVFLRMDTSFFCGQQRYVQKFPLYQRIMKEETLADFSKRVMIPLSYIEKLNPGLNPESVLQPNSTVKIAQSDFYPTLRDLLSAMLVYSDNDAFNRIYEVLGQDIFQSRLRELGMFRSAVFHRLLNCNDEINAPGPDYTLIDRDSVTLLVQSRSKSLSPLPSDNHTVKVGRKHIDANGETVKGGKDFSKKNKLPLTELHRLLEKLVLHDYIPENDRLQLGIFEQRTLMRWIGNHPREVHRMRTSHYNGLPDAYSNFLLFGGGEEKIPDHLRLFNISGWAYGFMTDCAYIVDFNSKTEVIVSARIYANKDGVVGNDRYEYDQLSKPFLRKLGQVVLQLEQKEKKEYLPNLMMYSGLFK